MAGSDYFLSPWTATKLSKAKRGKPVRASRKYSNIVPDKSEVG